MTKTHQPNTQQPDDLFERIKADLLAHEAKREAEEKKKLRQARKYQKEDD